MDNSAPVEILLVEDNPNDVTLVMRALKRNRVANNIEVVEDGAEALDFLFQKGRYASASGPYLPRVVFLDIKLPKISGLEVLKEIRGNEKTRQLPVVIVSSSREDPDISKAYELGANSYVVKPVDFESFFKVISDLGMYWLIINEPPKISL
ncbi:MAG: response regulator [Bacteroidota bacterium]